jgi:acetyltransferase-like isoleucine patch superfamily enzyme
MLDELLTRLKGVWLQRRREVAARWNRNLPFGDYIIDRWEKARELGFGTGSSIYDSVLVLGDVKVGERTWIGPFSVLDGSGGLKVGSNCSISTGVQIYSHDTVQWAISGGTAPYEYAATSIGNNCYIGPNTIVTKGVHIGDGCIIGANSIVNESIPSGSTAFGSPCKIQAPLAVNSNQPETVAKP